MSANSKIQWTEATWNPTTGCTKVSPGCANCYIERTIPFRRDHRAFVKGAIPVQLHEDRLLAPLRRRKPTTYFVNSLSDLFHEDIPDAFIDQMFAVMALTPHHTYQVLTKRAERMRSYMNGLSRYPEGHCWEGALRSFRVFGAENTLKGVDLPLRNVWLGVSVENQHFADERIPLLLQTPAAVRFISAEPLLGPVDIGEYLIRTGLDPLGVPEIQGWPLSWVIVGGESGPGARSFDLAWARSIVAQCKAAGVPVFVKQLGRWPVLDLSRDDTSRLLIRSRGRLKGDRFTFQDGKGGEPSEWPEDLRVREMPSVRELV